MKRINSLLLCCIFSLLAMAQEKKSFTLEDLIPGGNTFSQLLPENMYTTWWGSQCVETTLDGCYVVNPRSGKKTPLFTLEELNNWLGADKEQPLVRSCYYVAFPDAGQPYAAVSYRAGQSGAENRPMRCAWVDFKSGKVVWTQDIPWNAAAVDRSDVSRNVAYVCDRNLYVTDAEGRVMAVSTDGSDDLVYGQSVHRDEFGISKGTYWSPDGNLLAYYRMDQSMVPDYPQVDITQRIAATYSCKYPMAGEASHKVTVGVFNPATGQTVWLQAGDPTDRYFTNITWSPDSRKIYMIELNRDQNHAQLVCYDATTGEKEEVLYEEKHPKYVEPLHGLLFLPWDSHKFVYQSRRDGYNHLYLFDLNVRRQGEWKEVPGGGQCRENTGVTQLTSGVWEVKELLGCGTKDKSLVYCSNECHPLQSNIYKVKATGGKRTLLDNGKGVHAASLSEGGVFVFDRFSSPEVARGINLLPVSGGKGCNLLTAKDPWADYNVPEITGGSIKAADGVTDLYYRMIKPVDFDPNKKYPAVVYVYGGPHAHNVEASRCYYARGWEIYMAQKGYLVFVLDNRGSEHRGLAFENATFRHLGDVEMEDQMEGVKYLKSLPYVDGDRLGVHGWSFGGFMTVNMMLTYPDVFKVGVAGGPVVDWKYYEAMYGERYMDRPQDNPEGYQSSSLLPKVGRLEGKLQVIIGYNDPVCVPQHSLSLLRVAIDAGKQIDFFVYPGDEHNMMGRDRVHLHERITQYFEDYLK